MSGLSRIIDGVKVVEAEPGAPLPPGVPAHVERCELVETPDLSPAAKPWFVGLGAAGLAGGVAAIAFLALWGIPLALLSLVALYHGLVPGTKTMVMPSAHGRYLAFEADPDEVKREASFRLEPYLLGACVLLTFEMVNYFADRGEWWGVLIASVVCVVVFYYYGLRQDEWDASEAAASLRFRALADPTRPLADLQRADGNQLQEPAGEWVDSAGTAERLEEKTSVSAQDRSRDSRP